MEELQVKTDNERLNDALIARVLANMKNPPHPMLSKLNSVTEAELLHGYDTDETDDQGSLGNGLATHTNGAADGDGD